MASQYRSTDRTAEERNTSGVHYLEQKWVMGSCAMRIHMRCMLILLHRHGWTRNHMIRPVLTLFVWPELVPAVPQHQPCYHLLLAPCSTLLVRGVANPDTVKQQGSMTSEDEQLGWWSLDQGVSCSLSTSAHVMKAMKAKVLSCGFHCMQLCAVRLSIDFTGSSRGKIYGDSMLKRKG